MKDWDDWIEFVHNAALGADIWDLINPSKTEAEIQCIAPPVRPEPSNVKPSTVEGVSTTYSDLSTDEKEQLRQLQADYNYD